MLWMREKVTDRIPLCVVLLSSLLISFSRSPSYSKNEIPKPARKLLLSQYQNFDTWVLRGTCILNRGVLGVMWHNILVWLWAGLFAITQSWACIFLPLSLGCSFKRWYMYAFTPSHQQKSIAQIKLCLSIFTMTFIIKWKQKRSVLLGHTCIYISNYVYNFKWRFHTCGTFPCLCPISLLVHRVTLTYFILINEMKTHLNAVHKGGFLLMRLSC